MNLEYLLVASHPRVFFVPCRYLLPQPDCPILMIFVDPESCVVSRVIRMPVHVLTSRSRVHVKYGIDAIFRAKVDHSIEVLEATFLQNAGIHVVLKMSIVEWNTDTIELETGEELDIILAKMVL